MNRKGFTIIEGLVSLAALVLVVVVLTLIGGAVFRAKINHDERMKIPRPTQVLEDVTNDTDVTVKVEGHYDGWPYIVFQDKYTHTRILYYRGAMTYLTPKTNRVSKFNVEE